MSKSDKVLTPEYLDWHAKLTGLSSALTDKICFKLYKRYKKETGNEPWQLSEAHILRNSKPENKVSSFSGNVKKRAHHFRSQTRFRINYQIRLRALPILKIPK